MELVHDSKEKMVEWMIDEIKFQIQHVIQQAPKSWAIYLEAQARLIIDGVEKKFDVRVIE